MESPYCADSGAIDNQQL